MGWFSSLLQSLPFANAAMLFWGLAASLPIIIHLLSRRKYHEVTWAAMTFLLAAIRKNARRIRIEQLILLLVRVAILILLALALADPIFSLLPSLSAALRTRGRTHYVLVLDVSYSMDYVFPVPAATPPFLPDKARRAVRQALTGEGERLFRHLSFLATCGNTGPSSGSSARCGAS